MLKANTLGAARIKLLSSTQTSSARPNHAVPRECLHEKFSLAAHFAPQKLIEDWEYKYASWTALLIFSFIRLTC